LGAVWSKNQNVHEVAINNIYYGNYYNSRLFPVTLQYDKK